MLVLSRKASELIHIGDNVTVEVRRIAGNRVTLAISAPREVRVLRGELATAAKEFESEPVEAELAPQPQLDSQPAAESLQLTSIAAPLTGAPSAVTS